MIILQNRTEQSRAEQGRESRAGQSRAERSTARWCTEAVQQSCATIPAHACPHIQTGPPASPPASLPAQLHSHHDHQLLSTGPCQTAPPAHPPPKKPWLPARPAAPPSLAQRLTQRPGSSWNSRNMQPWPASRGGFHARPDPQPAAGDRLGMSRQKGVDATVTQGSKCVGKGAGKQARGQTERRASRHWPGCLLAWLCTLCTPGRWRVKLHMRLLWVGLHSCGPRGPAVHTHMHTCAYAVYIRAYTPSS